MKKLSCAQCLDKIYKLGRFGIKLELDTISDILYKLGNPEKKYLTIHIAGTNGKGSVASYLSTILIKAGFKTGLYTSPHLIKFNERILINNQQILDEDIIKAYETVDAADTGKRKATFFEIATAMSFYHFAKQNVDFAVIETGMGGRFDATNIIHPELSIITNIAIEHSEYLGKTIKNIAKEKSGIIKSKAPVITGVSQASALKVIKETAQTKYSQVFVYKKDFSMRKNPTKNTYTYHGLEKKFLHLKNPLKGKHQKDNLSLSLAACEILFKKLKNKKCNQNLIEQALLTTKWQGRLEYVQKNPLVIIDGAHNLKAARTLSQHLKAEFKNIILVIGILDDKPYEKILGCLVPCAKKIIITKAKNNRSLEPAVLQRSAKKITRSSLSIIEDVQKAVKHAIKNAQKGEVVCIAGSLYVAGEAKTLFNKTII